jgi:hypothetical protein
VRPVMGLGQNLTPRSASGSTETARFSGMTERRSTSKHGLKSEHALLLYILPIEALCEALWSANRRSTSPMNYISTDGMQCVSFTEGL